MFRSKKAMQAEIDSLRDWAKKRDEDYWVLNRRIYMLADHLGVSFEQVLAHEKLSKKGGPEQP